MIPIRNVYYMLAYAFRALNAREFRYVETEEFENAVELCAAILAKGMEELARRGIGRGFVGTSDAIASPRGKIDVADTVKTQSLRRKRVVCDYDEFSVDTKLNRIVKSTALRLMSAPISKARKQELRKGLAYFVDVGTIDLHLVDWNMRFNANTRVYQPLIALCNLIFYGLLQSDTDGGTKLVSLIDEQRMSRLYEQFLLEYYRKHFRELRPEPRHIGWALDADDDCALLPAMKTDVTLSRGDKVLIIDAKYYSKMTQVQFGVAKLHSGNLYQIFSYVKNKQWELDQSERPCRVAGLLLYAQTADAVLPNGDYSMSGNRIGARALDLNCRFDKIREQLDAIVGDYFADAE